MEKRKPTNKYVLFTAIILVSLVAFSYIYPILTNQNQTKQFVGSVNSNVYHYPSCRYVDQIKPENRIWFSSSQDARNHGYRPCQVCNPP